MGLDLVLAGLVLISAIRGWLQGFVLQAIRLIGLVVCVYAADPVRDVAKPQVIEYLPKIRPEIVDRLLWWTSAVLSYVILVGLATLVVKLYRRKPFGLEEPNRKDQFGGLLLGAVKGVIVAAFAVAGLQLYALDHLKNLPWAEDQAKESTAMMWNEKYKPVARVWATPPVRHFVDHVKRMGLTTPGAAEPSAESKPVQTASRASKLPWDSSSSSKTQVPDPDISKAVEEIKDGLVKASK